MEISVKNFGPIKHGSIDLSKRFYVFVGHNNSGKTYMANLVWGMNTAGVFNINFDNDVFVEKTKNNDIILNDDIFKYVVQKFSESLKKEYVPFWFSLNNENSTFQKTQIRIDYQVLKDNFYKSRIRLDTNKHTLIKERNTLIFKVSNYEKIEVKNIFDSLYTNMGFDYGRNVVADDYPFAKLICEAILQPYEDKLVPLVFLPANRIFYPSFYRYVYEAAKNDKDKIYEEVGNSNPSIEKIKSLSKRPYTKAMDYLLSAIYRLDASQKPNENYTDLLLKLRKLIGGEIVVKNAEGIGLNEFKLKMDSGEELDLYLSSSAANQLTTLYLYLKYWVNDSHNFLIMDEPEENLHPKHQIALLDILMQFANRNDNRVLITTHSSLLAESVNNHIQIGKLQDLGEDVERIVRENDLDISLNENLRPNDFGVYFFGNQTITPYDVDDYGVFFRDFKQEEDKVASIAEVLTDRIYKLKKAQKNEIETDRTVSISQ